MNHRVSGPFTVTMQPQPAPDPADGVTFGRALLDKRYEGALAAVAQGQMLSAVTGVAGSAGYVAIERVAGTLDGRAGSFVLQHTGTMNRGQPQLAIGVVPDSGSGELAGIAGTMAIRIEAGGKHHYDFDYTLP